jgi:quinol monooxygenase YgiN
MIGHVVFYKMKSGTSEADERSLIDQARRELAKLPGVMNLRVGRNIDALAQDYSVALVMDFQDEAALEAYRLHPEHQSFVKNIAGPLVSEIWRFDFRWS